MRAAEPPSALSAVSLFTGAGGLDLGFEAAGFEVLACLERDAVARHTLKTNRPAWTMVGDGDVEHVRASEILDIAGVMVGAIDVLIAGPPCQPFSKSAYWSSGGTRRLEDPRAGTIGAMMAIVEGLLPRAIVIENVRGIAYRRRDEAVALIQRKLALINRRHGTKYTLVVTPLNAASFGVPQLRERTFMTAFRNGVALIPPVPTHACGNVESRPAGVLPIRTAWDAVGDLAGETRNAPELRMSGKWADLLPSIPEGRNYLHHTKRGGGRPLFGWRTRYWSFLLKLGKALPSWTIQADPGPATGPFHWDNRLLSIEEMKRLQTFPDEYLIGGDYRAARRQVGNAVPPALAEAVARRIHSIISGETHCRDDLTLSTAHRPGMPPSTEPAPVLQKYLALLGTHDEHPGHGKGPRARLRGGPGDNADVSSRSSREAACQSTNCCL